MPDVGLVHLMIQSWKSAGGGAEQANKVRLEITKPASRKPESLGTRPPK